MTLLDRIREERLTLSFEVFPPKTDTSFENVREATERIAALGPAYVSVTYGAGGAGSRFTMDIAREQKRRALVAEIQSANWGAYSFLTEMGLKVIGFDLMGYTNDGMKDRSFPILMGREI